jgi:hypothetical protein
VWQDRNGAEVLLGGRVRSGLYASQGSEEEMGEENLRFSLPAHDERTMNARHLLPPAPSPRVVISLVLAYICLCGTADFRPLPQY